MSRLQGRDVYRTRDLLKISPRSSGAKHKSVSRTICRKHCAPLEREYRVHSIIYKHLAPLERKRIPLLHLEVEFTTVNIRKNFFDNLSNSVRAVRLYREGRTTGPPKD